MGIMGDVSNFLSGGGRDEANQGYNNANNQLNPYVQQGRQGDAQLQSLYGQNQASLNQMNSQFGNPASWEYSQINQSPTQFYQNIMGSYSQSPQAKYAQDQAMRAANAGASASGMVGSGAYFKGLQNNANDISQRDQQQYYSNVMNANQAQQQYLGNFQSQQNLMQQRMQQISQYLSTLGYGAATGMATNDINQGKSNAGYDQSAFNDLSGLAGGGIQAGYNAAMRGAPLM